MLSTAMNVYVTDAVPFGIHTLPDELAVPEHITIHMLDRSLTHIRTYLKQDRTHDSDSDLRSLYSQSYEYRVP